MVPVLYNYENLKRARESYGFDGDSLVRNGFLMLKCQNLGERFLAGCQTQTGKGGHAWLWHTQQTILHRQMGMMQTTYSRPLHISSRKWCKPHTADHCPWADGNGVNYIQQTPAHKKMWMVQTTYSRPLYISRWEWCKLQTTYSRPWHICRWEWCKPHI